MRIIWSFLPLPTASISASFALTFRTDSQLLRTKFGLLETMVRRVSGLPRAYLPHYFPGANSSSAKSSKIDYFKMRFLGTFICCTLLLSFLTPFNGRTWKKPEKLGLVGITWTFSLLMLLIPRSVFSVGREGELQTACKRKMRKWSWISTYMKMLACHPPHLTLLFSLQFGQTKVKSGFERSAAFLSFLSSSPSLVHYSWVQ